MLSSRYLGSLSWSSDTIMEAVNCKIKFANSKPISVNVLAYNNFKWTEKGATINAEVWIIESYYSLLKSHLAVQICTVSYVEYLGNFQEIVFDGALRWKKWDSVTYCNSKIRHLLALHTVEIFCSLILRNHWT